MKKQAGFTLIEVMIVVVIVSVIAAFAYPAYTDSVRKARRADGTSALLEVANHFERCFTNSGRYTGAGCPADQDSVEGFYRITVGVPTASTYTLTATPQNEQLGDVGDCPTMTLTEAGVKTPDPDPNRCWNN